MTTASRTTKTVWLKESSAAFLKSRERYGDLGNMTNGMPVTAKGILFQSSEGLYQALKFPESQELQARIAAARSGFDAKRAAYESGVDPMSGWNGLRKDAMAFALAAKLMHHHERFGWALEETGELDIVEISRRDAYWGAQPGGAEYIGCNELGKLLTELRNLLREQGDPRAAVRKFLSGRTLGEFALNGRKLA